VEKQPSFRWQVALNERDHRFEDSIFSTRRAAAQKAPGIKKQ